MEDSAQTTKFKNDGQSVGIVRFWYKAAWTLGLKPYCKWWIKIFLLGKSFYKTLKDLYELTVDKLYTSFLFIYYVALFFVTFRISDQYIHDFFLIEGKIHFSYQARLWYEVSDALGNVCTFLLKF